MRAEKSIRRNLREAPPVEAGMYSQRLATTVGLLLMAASLGVALSCGRTAPVTPSTDAGVIGFGDAGSTAVGERDDGGATLATLDPTEATSSKLEAFASEEDMTAYFARWRERRAELLKPPPPKYLQASADAGASLALPRHNAPPAAAAAEASKASRAPVGATGTGGGKPESITNNQHEGVDEGDIVKLHGEHLVVLRRGRLFTVKIGDGALTPVSRIDAYGPGIDPRGTWYDEMLVDGDTVIVIGYSYDRGGTEVGLFRVDAGGKLSYRATYHLRSNDYYSARNYASRVVGGKLVFYSPMAVSTSGFSADSYPSVRKWHANAQPEEFQRIIEPKRIFHLGEANADAASAAMHTVTVCDLKDFACTATGMIGPQGRVFYVSEESVYVWMKDPTYGRYGAPSLRGELAILARLSISREANPTAIRVTGSPIDQLSFLEEHGHLNVLVMAEGNGEAMWQSDGVRGDTALMRVPLSLFADGVRTVSPSRFHTLPRLDGGGPAQNRFVGDYLLYGTSPVYGTARTRNDVIAYRYAGDAAPDVLDVGHKVERIEAIGENAIAVGQRDQDLVFTTLALTDHARLANALVRKDASQGDDRTHGFFYKPDSATSGVLGLPVMEEARPGSRHPDEGSASVVFLANDALALRALGTLTASPLNGVNDGCRASCIDWYGDARPIFAKGRVFALLGYELIEGKRVEDKLVERRRTNFQPWLGPPAEDW